MNGPNINYEFNYREQVETNGQLDIEKVKKVLYEYELLKEKIDRDERETASEIERLEDELEDIDDWYDRLYHDYEMLRRFVDSVAEGEYTLEDAINGAAELLIMTTPT